jgi:hypothetical protein
MAAIEEEYESARAEHEDEADSLVSALDEYDPEDAADAVREFNEDAEENDRPYLIVEAEGGGWTWEERALFGWSTKSERFDESKHPRAGDGKFGSGAGSGGQGGNKPPEKKPNSDAQRRKETRDQVADKVRQATHAATKKTVAALIKVAKTGEHLEHVASQYIAKQVARLPAPIRLPVVGAYKAAMASYTVAQSAVKAVAAERGFTSEQIEHVSEIVGVVDLVGGGKVFPGILKATGFGALAYAGGFVPVGSIGYLAYSTARDPMATTRAAKKAVAKVAKKVRLVKGGELPTSSKAIINAILEAVAATKKPDVWAACFLAAMDLTGGSVPKSLEIVGTLLGTSATARKVEPSQKAIRTTTREKAMASEQANAPAPMPIGAQILRKLHGGLRSLSEEITKMAGQMEQCDSKDAIGSLVGGIGTAVGDIEKNWGKFYKELDLAAPEEEVVEGTKAEGGETDVDAIIDELGDLGGDGDGDEDDEEANMTPEEKRAVESQIKKLEAELAHADRLERIARLK